MSVRVNRLPHNELREQLARSGENAEFFAADLAAQPELLAAAAELLKKRNGEVASIQSDLEAPATSAKKKSKKASKAVLDELLGGLKDGGTTTALGSALRKECKAAVRLAKHMQGDKRGQVSGKAFYTIVPCVSRLCACCLSTVCGSASRCLCACCASVCRVCGSRSSRVCVCASERVLGWQATRLAVKKTVIKTTWYYIY